MPINFEESIENEMESLKRLNDIQHGGSLYSLRVKWNVLSVDHCEGSKINIAIRLS